MLDDLPSLRTALQKRRRDRSGLLKLLERLIGMDLKLRQYEQGKAFCDGVVARAGIEGLNRVWISPESMPTVTELERPRGLARAHGTAAAAPFRLTNSRSYSHKVRAGFTACSRARAPFVIQTQSNRCNPSRTSVYVHMFGGNTRTNKV